MEKEQLYIYILASFIGIISGLSAVAFRWLIVIITSQFILLPRYFGVWTWSLIPMFGGLVVAFIVYRHIPAAEGHGVPELMEFYTHKGGKIRFRVTILKSFASAFSIGSGGSCGPEEPIAQIGGGIGSSMATYLKLNSKSTRTLLVCGTASGIAATFNAPLGGTLFAIEIIAGGILTFSIIQRCKIIHAFENPISIEPSSL